MEIRDNEMYLGGMSARTIAEKIGTPVFVYEEDMIRSRFRSLRESFTWPRTQVLYACKSNANIEIMRVLRDEGAGIDAVSPGEVFLALKAGFSPEKILFSGNNATDDEMRYIVGQNVLVNCDSLSQLRRYGRINPCSRTAVRINPDVGAGHHSHTITGGPDSKFGIYFDKVDEIKAIAKEFDLTIAGVHQHIGSGILDPDIYMIAVEVLLKVAPQFDNLTFVDFGGGYGVAYKPDDKPLDVPRLGGKISERFKKFCDEYGKELILKIEPGRFPVCEAGVLLVRATAIKETPKHIFVGTDSGFNHLVRHTMYGSYHPINNATNMEAEKLTYAVAGNICESGDLFTHGREISAIREGDILAIMNAGAYGYAMASNYNSRPRPAEVMVLNGQLRIIRQREVFEDLLRGQVV